MPFDKLPAFSCQLLIQRVQIISLFSPFAFSLFILFSPSTRCISPATVSYTELIVFQ
jgi:hypothetical protein